MGIFPLARRVQRKSKLAEGSRTRLHRGCACVCVRVRVRVRVCDVVDGARLKTDRRAIAGSRDTRRRALSANAKSGAER